MSIQLKKDMLFANRYRLVGVLGNGKSSEVWHASDILANVNVALKIYFTKEEAEIALEKFTMVFDINHMNILHPVFLGCHEDMIYEVMQYCKLGSILRLIEDGTHLSEETCWKIMHDVSEGLSCLHDRRVPILHLDIKPHNILTHATGHFMISDFGISDYCSEAKQESGKGTPDYMAPERFKEENSPIKANDIWSLGVMMYEIMSGGDLPFGRRGGEALSPSDAIPSITSDYSSDLKQLVYRCLSFYPWDRPVAKEIATYANNKLSK